LEIFLFTTIKKHVKGDFSYKRKIRDGSCSDFLSKHSFGGGTTGGAAREETATEKRAFEGTIAMYTTTAEASNFARCIEAGQRLTIGPQNLA
jgi:hypothetical protein